jgi:hypothetical protein
MSRARSTFRRHDVRAAIEAAQAAGKEVVRVEIECGKIILVTKPQGTESSEGANEWDRI